MSYSPNGRMSAFGAGLLRLWTERQIAEGRSISAAELARDATRLAPAAIAGPVQARTPWGLILGRDINSQPEFERLLAYFKATPEDVERIGNGESGILEDVVEGWAA